jgi:hypothetical protein
MGVHRKRIDVTIHLQNKGGINLLKHPFFAEKGYAFVIPRYFRIKYKRGRGVFLFGVSCEIEITISPGLFVTLDPPLICMSNRSNGLCELKRRIVWKIKVK